MTQKILDSFARSAYISWVEERIGQHSEFDELTDDDKTAWRKVVLTVLSIKAEKDQQWVDKMDANL